MAVPRQIKTSRKYHPKGFDILYEDEDIIVGDKAPGFLSVNAAWDRKAQNIYYALNAYVRKGNSGSRKCVYVVHRLDQGTSGVLVFARNERTQVFLKDHWKETRKIYYAVVHGHWAKTSGILESFLVEDEEYRMRATTDIHKGKLARTAYTIVRATARFSLVEVELLTGRKNQVRVHFADAGHPVVGDAKYGRPSDARYPRMALHARSITFTHPRSKERMTFEAKVPEFFMKLVPFISGHLCYNNVFR